MNQIKRSEKDEVDNTNLNDEETEFLLEEYNQTSSIDEFEELSEEKAQYEGTKVILS